MILYYLHSFLVINRRRTLNIKKKKKTDYIKQKNQVNFQTLISFSNTFLRRKIDLAETQFLNPLKFPSTVFIRVYNKDVGSRFFN